MWRPASWNQSGAVFRSRHLVIHELGSIEPFVSRARINLRQLSCPPAFHLTCQPVLTEGFALVAPICLHHHRGSPSSFPLSLSFDTPTSLQASIRFRVQRYRRQCRQAPRSLHQEASGESQTLSQARPAPRRRAAARSDPRPDMLEHALSAQAPLCPPAQPLRDETPSG